MLLFFLRCPRSIYIYSFCTWASETAGEQLTLVVVDDEVVDEVVVDEVVVVVVLVDVVDKVEVEVAELVLVEVREVEDTVLVV